MDQNQTSVEVLNNGYEDNSQEEQYHQLHVFSDTSVSLGSEGNRRQSCQRAICKVGLCVTLVLFVVVVSFVIGHYVGHKSWKKEPEPPAHAPSQYLASAAGNSILTASNMQEDIKNNIDVKGSSCNGRNCTRCEWTIHAPAQAVNVNDDEGTDCRDTATHAGYRNCSTDASFDCTGQCLQCHNNTCRSYSSMVQYLDQNSPCTTVHEEKIMCCTLLHMRPADYCLNGGKLICEGLASVSEPYCKCPEGWTGSRCESRMIEHVTCKCFKTDITFCGENRMHNCSDDKRPKDWTECRQNIEGTTLSRCICEKSAVDLSTTSLPKCEETVTSVKISTTSSVTIATPSYVDSHTGNGAAMNSKSIASTFTFSVILICSTMFQAIPYI